MADKPKFWAPKEADKPEGKAAEPKPDAKAEKPKKQLRDVYKKKD